MTAEMDLKLIEKNGALGLYIHVPFCAKKCEYCAFYKEKADKTQVDLYMKSIVEELNRFPPGRDANTVFMGGGTPSLLSAHDLDELCKAIRKAAGNKITEWTIECAPGTIKKDKIEVLKKWGVNRFSLGVQSFNEKTLAAIGRPHSLKQIQEAVELIRNSATNWNMDLIFAAAESTLPEWREDLRQAIRLGSTHISTYCLTFESDTQIYLKMLKGLRKRPGAEEEAAFYKETWGFLRKGGFHHYEVANFARAGFECQHNLNTWRMQEWLGYGPAAASQARGAESSYRRYTNIPDLKQWAEGIKTGQRIFVDEAELTPVEMALDRIIFGLRMPDGIRIKEIAAALPAATVEKLERLGRQLEEQGLLEKNGDLWRLTQDGLLVADLIGAEVTELAP
jgi:oxygen-independent coproporphyrinogen-3 oxidase